MSRLGRGLWLEQGRIYQAESSGSGWQRGNLLANIPRQDRSRWRLEVSHDPQSGNWAMKGRGREHIFARDRELNVGKRPLFLGLHGRAASEQEWRIGSDEVVLELQQRD